MIKALQTNVTAYKYIFLVNLRYRRFCIENQQITLYTIPVFKVYSSSFPQVKSFFYL